MKTFQECVRGVVFGLAYGDAMGAPIEKLKYEEIKSKYGRVETLDTKWYKVGWPADKRFNKTRGYGIVTDDTLMMLSLMNVYCTRKRHIDAYDFATEFIKEIAYKQKYIPEFGKNALLIERLFYPEKYPFIRLALANCEPRQGGIGNMVNCGAAMYIAPIGVVNACNPKSAYEEAIAFAMAHQCSYGLEAAGVLAACVAKAFEPKASIEDIIITALQYAHDGTKQAIEAIYSAANRLKQNNQNKDFIVNEFHKVLRDFLPYNSNEYANENIDNNMPSIMNTPSRIFSIEELPIALGYIIINDGDFYQSVIDGINSGNDTDSIGAMIGAILGALHGDKAIRQNDIETLEKVNKLCLADEAEKFTTVAAKIIESDICDSNYRAEILGEIGI